MNEQIRKLAHLQKLKCIKISQVKHYSFLSKDIILRSKNYFSSVILRTIDGILISSQGLKMDFKN